MQNRLYTTFWFTRKLLKLGKTVLWKFSAIIYSIVCNDNLIRRGNIDATNIWFRRKVCLGIIWETNNSSPVSRKGIEGISPWPRPCLRVITGEGHCNQRIKTNTNTKKTQRQRQTQTQTQTQTQRQQWCCLFLLQILPFSLNPQLMVSWGSVSFFRPKYLQSTPVAIPMFEAKWQQSAAMQVLLPGLGRLEAAATGAPPSITTLFIIILIINISAILFAKNTAGQSSNYFFFFFMCALVLFTIYIVLQYEHIVSSSEFFWIYSQSGTNPVESHVPKACVDFSRAFDCWECRLLRWMSSILISNWICVGKYLKESYGTSK